MRLPSYEKAIALTAMLTVLNQDTSTLLPFKLNREQRRILRAILAGRRTVILKGRQVGCSTVVVFAMTLVAMMNPGLPLVIVADDADKAKGLLKRARDWLIELGVGLSVDAKESITLVNGATIEAKSAISPAEGGESKVGRSKPYGFILCTEMAFWRNAGAVWAALSSTMLSTALVVVESTGTPGETRFREIYDDAKKTGWQQLFFGVEQHRAYRADPASIDDETWARLQKDYGFSRRNSAAWWYAKLTIDFKGDIARMLREYPVIADHSFTFRDGLHISAFTQVRVRVDGAWNFYVEPRIEKEDDEIVSFFDEPVVLGVDTAAGLGLDASALAGIGHISGRVLFTWRDNLTPIPQFIPLIKTAIARFRPVATVVESNGVGQAVFQSCDGLAGVDEQKSGNRDGEVQKRRDSLRDAIQAGDVPIGGHLAAEAKSSQVKAVRRQDGTVRVAFVGMDDVLSAVSFARKWREENPYVAPKQETEDRTRYFVARKLEGMKKAQTATW